MSLRGFSAEYLTCCVVARFFCGASHALCRCEAFRAEQSHALCHYEIFLRSGLVLCVVANFFCVAVSRFVSLRNLFA